MRYRMFTWRELRHVDLSYPIKLVCFAVPQEAKPFAAMMCDRSDVAVMLTGMGVQNAERAVRAVLARCRTVTRVFSCGFAGGLNPDLNVGDVVTSTTCPLPRVKQVTFACTSRVAVTVAEKAALRARTGADAVEMESAAIERVCREAGVPCVTLRAISDSAHDDLPLDFNALLTAEHELSVTKLALAVVSKPWRIPALIELGRNSAFAARELATVLSSAVGRAEPA